MNHRKQTGFTIVELLIVIIIIAILAAIVVVAYQGITNKANASKYQTEISVLAKKATTYETVKSSYALTAAGTDAASIATQSTAGSNLTAALNNVPDSKLPPNVAVFGTVAWATVPTFAQAMTAINASATIDYYFVAYCATGGGMRIYYPDPASSSVKTQDVGVCP